MHDVLRNKESVLKNNQLKLYVQFLYFCARYVRISTE